MTLWHYLKRPPWRTLLLLMAILAAAGLAWLLWSPGKVVRDGSHDLRTNGIWIQHGWLSDDQWFTRNKRDATQFRDDRKIQALADLLAIHGVKYVFPHLCPCDPSGTIAPADPQQTERFLDHFQKFNVIPWVGGVLDVQCSPESPQWRATFIASVVDLLNTHPRLAGVQLNIEPMPAGNPHFLLLLEELRRAIPQGKIISVAAYPPPTWLHRFPDVHWDESYFRQVSKRADLLAVMMYDTAVDHPKLYQHLMASWTGKILLWSGNTQVLLGLPAYDDAGVGYHNPRVENLQNALLGVHAGLAHFTPLPANYAGIAVYCEWEMNTDKWNTLRKEFEQKP